MSTAPTPSAGRRASWLALLAPLAALAEGACGSHPRPVELSDPGQPCTFGRVLDTLPFCTALPPIVLTGTSSASGILAVDDQNLYHADQRSIWAESRPLGGMKVLAAIEQVAPFYLPALALDATNVYFAAANLSRVPKVGGAVEVLSPAPAGAVVTSSDGIVYFTNSTPGETLTVRRWSETGGVELVATLNMGAAPGYRLAVADGFLYLSIRAQPGFLTRVELASGADEMTLWSHSPLNDFAVAGGLVYFTESDTRSLKTIPVAGGDVTTLATFAGMPWALDTDGTHVYTTVHYAGANVPGLPDTTDVLVRMTTGGQDACLVGTAWGAPPSVVIHGPDVFWTGECGLTAHHPPP